VQCGLRRDLAHVVGQARVLPQPGLRQSGLRHHPAHAVFSIAAVFYWDRNLKDWSFVFRVPDDLRFACVADGWTDRFPMIRGTHHLAA